MTDSDAFSSSWSNKQETPNAGTTLANSTSTDASSSDTEPRRVWRKIDICILPIMIMFQLLAILDQSNIANARVAGLQEDLKLSDYQYTVTLTVVYASFIAAEIPGNLLLRTVGPNLMLPAMLVLWGIVTTFQGFVKGYSDLLACRFLLGLFEGGGFACIPLYLSFWYPRHQLQWRLSVCFVIPSLAGAFSGLLAYGIIRMDGLGQRPGWAWIFILEGLFSTLFGLSAFFTLPHSPARAPFLKDAEKHYVISRLRESGAMGHDDEADAFSWREVSQALTLPHVWMLSLIYFFSGAITLAFVYFTPSIVAGLGYDRVQAQLYSVPPTVAAFFISMIAAYFSDRFGARGLSIILSSTLMIIGFVMFLASKSSRIKYGSLFLIVTGSHSLTPALSAWSANNVAPYTRRATAFAIGLIMTNSGGILATWLLGSLSPPPFYKSATITFLAFSVMILVVTGFNIAYLSSQNRRKSATRAEVAHENEPPNLGDRSAWFMYSL